MASLVFRDGYLGGVARRIGYLGDLRLSPAVQGRHLLNRVYGPTLTASMESRGCEASLTAVIASNERALRALAAQNRRQRGMPRYTPLRDFRIRNVHLALPRFRQGTAFRVRRATEADVPARAAFLDADARGRPFGQPMPEAELRRRLREWPGLRIDSFYLAEDGSGALVGCLAMWDAARQAHHRRRVPWRDASREDGLRSSRAAAALSPPSQSRAGAALPVRHAPSRAVRRSGGAARAAAPRLRRPSPRRIRAALVLCARRRSAGRGVPRLPVHRSAGPPVRRQPGVDPPAECFAPGRPGFEMALV